VAEDDCNTLNRGESRAANGLSRAMRRPFNVPFRDRALTTDLGGRDETPFAPLILATKIRIAPTDRERPPSGARSLLKIFRQKLSEGRNRE